MKPFIQNQPLKLTPLTPIHIGCGRDFEPTNYIIHDEVLFHFDPAEAELTTQDRTALTQAVGRGGSEGLLNVHRFFRARREQFAGAAKLAVPVAPGVARMYEERIARIAQHESGGKTVFNRLEIERTAFEHVSSMPYLPGSSLKGAIRTAWLNARAEALGYKRLERSATNNPSGMARALEKMLAGGSFASDPLRLLALSDSRGQQVFSRIYFSSNHHKRQKFRDGKPQNAQGPITRREAIVGAQYRALSGELRLNNLQGRSKADATPPLEHRLQDFSELACICNEYYVPRLDRLLRLLDQRRLVDPDWLERTRSLIDRLRNALQSGQMMLLRVGRHSGAENVTLDEYRSIKIMRGKNAQPVYTNKESTTVWLAADEQNARSAMLPFGWLLVEPAEAAEHEVLKHWCEQQGSELQSLHQRLNAARDEARQALEQSRQRQREQEQAREREAENAKRIAAMSEQEQLIHKFECECERLFEHDQRAPFNPGSGPFGMANRLSQQALQEGTEWSDEDRRRLAELIEHWLPQVVAGYKPRDARKKLKLAKLKGE